MPKENVRAAALIVLSLPPPDSRSAFLSIASR
jgi:hypothetical protein